MTKRVVPIVFSLDNRIVDPYIVCVKSLIASANSDTFYEIFILRHPSQSDSEIERRLIGVEVFGQCSVTLVNVSNDWENSFEIRDITVASYYRLMIPNLLLKYDKVIYSDVDVIFRSDLSDLYFESLKNNELVAGVREIDDYSNSKTVVKVHNYYESIGCDISSYINGGFLIMNLAAMRKEGVVDKFLSHANRNYITQDQDILNIVCRGRIELLPFRWNYTSVIYGWSHKVERFVSDNEDEIALADKVGTVHYTGAKPWNEFCTRYDIWWSLCRDTDVFDSGKCFSIESFAIKKMHEKSVKRRILMFPKKIMRIIKG